MAERTINGKTFEKVIAELKADFNPNEFKYDRDNHPYLPIERFRSRMDTVIGILNYDFVLSEPQITIVGTRPKISLTGSVTLRDDNGNVVVTKSAAGGTDVIIVNETKEACAVNNDLESAAADVFKRCCKCLGIAEQLKKMKKNGANQSNSNNEISARETVLYKVKIREAFTSKGKEGFGTWVDIEGEKEPRMLMIWKAGRENIEKHITMDKFFHLYGANTTLSLYGYKSVFQPKNGGKQLQLILDRPDVKEKEG